MKDTVLVPLDGSELAEHALPLAMSLAQRLKGELILLQVISPWPLRDSVRELNRGETAEKGLNKEAEKYLKGIADRVMEGGIPTRYMLTVGSFAEGIAQVADNVQAAYVVMATHGRTGFSRWALGSVTGRVLQLTGRPLLLLRPPGDDSVRSQPSIRRIVVPLDGTPLAAQALPHARALAHLYEAELLLFRAIQRLPHTLLSESELKETWYAELGAEARMDLTGILGQLQAEGITARFEIGIEPAADAILSYGQAMNADLIVMASNAHGWLGRTLWGSVTDRVVRAGEFPVLVTRAAADSG